MRSSTEPDCSVPAASLRSFANRACGEWIVLGVRRDQLVLGQAGENGKDRERLDPLTTRGEASD
jgi:hypothetical protein